MGSALGAEIEVVEEGLNGRTTVFDDPVEGTYKNGFRYLPACLESHAPLDAVIIMLGTNDLKIRFSVPPPDIAMGAARLATLALGNGLGPDGRSTAVLLVAPFIVGDSIRNSPFGEMFGFETAIEKSRRFGACFAKEAAALGVPCLDSGEVVKAHPLDAIHLTAESQRALGLAVAAELRRLPGFSG
jgi:lysophospholipase L1-like esterase